MDRRLEKSLIYQPNTGGDDSGLLSPSQRVGVGPVCACAQSLSFEGVEGVWSLGHFLRGRTANGLFQESRQAEGRPRG